MVNCSLIATTAVPPLPPLPPLPEAGATLEDYLMWTVTVLMVIVAGYLGYTIRKKEERNAKEVPQDQEGG